MPRSLDSHKLRSHLENSDLCNNPPQELHALATMYNSTLTEPLYQHAPLKAKLVTVRQRVPWFNNDIKEAKRNRRRAEKTWRKSKLQADFALYTIWRNRVTNLMTIARCDFYRR